MTDLLKGLARYLRCDLGKQLITSIGISAVLSSVHFPLPEGCIQQKRLLPSYRIPEDRRKQSLLYLCVTAVSPAVCSPAAFPLL